MDHFSLKEAALAGLLHDVGLLEQLVESAGADPSRRAALASRFVQTYVPESYRPTVLSGCQYETAGSEESSPADPLALTVALADRLSRGVPSLPVGGTQPTLLQLVSIFDRTALNAERKTGDWHYVALAPLELNKDVLFDKQQLAPKDQASRFFRQARDAVGAACAQPAGNIDSYLENLLGVLQRQAWCIPAAGANGIPDVSFYDHSRMTSALAACLTDISEAMPKLWRTARGGDQAGKWAIEPVCQLVGGDISGIQDFIYTTSAKKAAQTLRGRSFYLQLLTEAVLRYILSELDLPYTNVIYSGGGHFFLLAPARAGQSFAAIQKEITRKLFRHHQTSLYLTVACAPIPLAGFKEGAFTQYWDEVHRQLETGKLRRYAELGDALYQTVFKPPTFGGDISTTCSVCGEDYRKVRPFDDERNEQARICTLCDSFISEIGAPMAGSAFVTLGLSKGEETAPGTAGDTLRAFGLSFQFLHPRERVSLPGADRVVIWAFDDPAHGWPEVDSPDTVRLLHYALNRVPAVTFDELQQQVRGGFERLGVLRMDVDNLSDIFKTGFGQPGAPTNIASLARLAGLSFRLSIFFEGWVKKLCEDAQYQGLIYSVYAGGDDLFLIGPWDIMPGLAQQISKDFTLYTGENPDYHLSAGLAFIDGKYPVYQAAQDSATELNKAKRYDGKSAFTFLGSSDTWVEFGQVERDKETLKQIVTEERDGSGRSGGPRSLLQTLQRLAEDRASHAKNAKGKEIWGPWIWQGMYFLTRLAQRVSALNKNTAQAILQIRDELHDTNYQTLSRWGKAALWAELLTRKKT